ncbi:hypothetical protein BJ912DRAFT_1149430 [Pholiota molesta]|nr:hypothetical protein BJ912DRAFT_1149430 [Pholiota molesta]
MHPRGSARPLNQTIPPGGYPQTRPSPRRPLHPRRSAASDDSSSPALSPRPRPLHAPPYRYRSGVRAPTHAYSSRARGPPCLEARGRAVCFASRDAPAPFGFARAAWPGSGCGRAWPATPFPAHTRAAPGAALRSLARGHLRLRHRHHHREHIDRRTSERITGPLPDALEATTRHFARPKTRNYPKGYPELARNAPFPSHFFFHVENHKNTSPPPAVSHPIQIPYHLARSLLFTKRAGHGTHPLPDSESSFPHPTLARSAFHSHQIPTAVLLLVSRPSEAAATGTTDHGTFARMPTAFRSPTRPPRNEKHASPKKPPSSATSHASAIPHAQMKTTTVPPASGTIHSIAAADKARRKRKPSRGHVDRRVDILSHRTVYAGARRASRPHADCVRRREGTRRFRSALNDDPSTYHAYYAPTSKPTMAVGRQQ